MPYVEGDEGLWAGGRKWQTADGSIRWIIREKPPGSVQRYSITLDVESESEALVELAAFRKAPEAYRTSGQLRAEKTAHKVTMTAEHIADFIKALKKTERSKDYVRGCLRYLSAWAAALEGRDLATLDSKTVLKTLNGWATASKWRKIAFKSFCSWLVERGDLDANQDPGRHLVIEASERKHEEKGYSIAEVEGVYAALPSQVVRDTLCVMAKTGMHLTELARLCAGVELEKGDPKEIRAPKKQVRRRGKDQEKVEHPATLQEWAGMGDIKAVATFRHKTGKLHRLSLDGQALAAVRRLMTRGGTPTPWTCREALERVNKHNPELPWIDIGSIRHSFGTWLTECGEVFNPHAKDGLGLGVDLVAQALGHSNTETTKRHYLNSKVPVMYRVAIKLDHPDDAKPLRVVA